MSTRLQAQAFWVTKAGNVSEEYEDAFAIRVRVGHFAIADGATDASFAKEWARLLTRRFVADPSCLTEIRRGSSRESCMSRWLAPLQRNWHDAIDWSAIPWWAEDKARKGAFATFVGLKLHKEVLSSNRHRWQAIAVGDCLLFHVCSNRLTTAFPLTHAKDIDSRPSLLCSNKAGNHPAGKEIQIKHGYWRSGDTFLLCTDELAKWFLTQWEAGAKPWSLLCNLHSQEEFTEFVTRLRSERLVVNDDMTVVTIIT